jgi:hypothetical protein
MNIKRKHAVPIVLCIMVISCCVTFFTTAVFRAEYVQYGYTSEDPKFEGCLPARFNFITDLIINQTLLLILGYLILSILVSIWCLKPKENSVTKFLWIIAAYLIFSFIINFHNIRMIYYFCFEIHHQLG